MTRKTAAAAPAVEPVEPEAPEETAQAATGTSVETTAEARMRAGLERIANYEFGHDGRAGPADRALADVKKIARDHLVSG